MIIRSSGKVRLLLAAAPLALTLGATPAFAADQPATQPDTSAAPEEPEAEVVVTGSRITRPDLVGSSPIATISAEALKTQNTITVEQILTANPQFQPGGTGASNNPGDGAATVDLRGLGPNRTLVLIDGKRAPSYDTTGAVDVNTIPTALIKRIDILTGGASAVYGSDAIAGVVNFVLDDRFTGLRADGSAQISRYGDAGQYDAALTGGIKLGDRGNLVASVGYSKRNTLKFGDRSLLTHTVDSNDPCLSHPSTCTTDSGGSSNTTPTAFDIPGAGRQQIRDDGSLSSDVIPYGFNSVNYGQIPLERYNGMALGRYEIADGIEIYGRGNYEHVKSITNLAPTATAGYTFDISPNNPFLTAGERAAFFDTAANPDLVINPDGTSTVGIRRRVTETGGRTELHTTESYQLVGGVRGAINPDFSFDAFVQYGHVKKHEVLTNDLSYSALTQALDVVSGPNGPQCRDTSGGCIPLNLFTTGTLSAKSLAFVLRNATQDTTTSQFIAGGNVTGNLRFIQSPFANNPAAINVGVEYRREKGVTTVSDDYASGDLIYYGQGQNIGGRYDTKEVYIEAKIPIVQDRPFIHALDLEGGYRYSDYSTAGGVSTYKYGGDYSPVDGLRFRGIYQRAVRAPNIYELYSPVIGGTGSLNADPCAGTISTAVATICQAQGAPASSIGRIPEPVAGQINIFTGGNPDLEVEKSDTFTVGVVVNPPSLRAFSMSLDYYNIKINNAIDVASPQSVINACFNSGSAAACQSIKRNTLDGSLSGNLKFGVPATEQNLTQIATDGLEFNTEYHGATSGGFTYAVSYAANYVFNYKQDGYQYAGHFGADSSPHEPMSRYKHVVTVGLGLGGVNLTTRWRFLSKVTADADTDILKSTIPAFSYFDETATFSVNKSFDFRVGVQNMFDKQPPIVGSTVGTDSNAGNTFPNTYDVIGRSFFAGFSAKF